MIEKTKNLLRHYAEMVSIHFKNGKPISKKKPFIPAATYINTEHKLESFVKKMKYVNEISVDIEGNSLYTYYPKICLIQISTRSENFIIDPLSIKNASLLDSIFSDKNIQKVFHGATYDTQMLYSHLGIIVNNLFDTQIAVSFLGEKRTSLDFLVEKNFNVHLEKKYQKSNWAIRPLSKKMLEYAISDTKYLLPLADILKKALINKNRLSWVTEECEILAGSAKHHQSEKVLNMKGFGKIPKTCYPILVEILTLREEIAKEKDIPPFKVLDKQTIYKIITENSLTLEKLKQITSSYRQIQDYLPLMFEKIQHPQHQNRFPRKNLIHKQNNYHPDFSQKAEKLHIWRDSKAAELKIAPHLVLSHRQISSLASASINNINDIRQVKILKTWQKQQFGDEIYRIVYSAKNIKDKSRS